MFPNDIVKLGYGVRVREGKCSIIHPQKFERSKVFPSMPDHKDFKL